MEIKKIVQYLDRYTYCILVPVYYECEEKPAWRKCFVGTKEECENKFDDYPDFYKATNEENQEMRESRFREYLFLKETNKRKSEMEQIKKAYNF